MKKVDMIRVLLLGGVRHWDTELCDSDFPSSITTGCGTPTETTYHRAVFRFPLTGAAIDKFWFVYESDDYRGSMVERPLSDILQALSDENIPPVDEAVDVVNLNCERMIREIPSS